VLIANLIAIPAMIAFNVYSQRRAEAADRFALGPEVFLPVIAGSILVALLATFGHAWQVTGARPVTALRYE
jgi:hypothetical protein